MNVPGHPFTSKQVRSEHGGAVPMIAEASRRLQAVSSRLRTFLQQKLKQIEAVAVQCEQIVTQRDSLLQLKEEVLRHRGEWERGQQGRTEELQCEQERLIEAWQKLDDERRQFLMQKESMELPGGNASSSVDSYMPLFGADAPSDPRSPFETKTAATYAEPKRIHGPAAVAASRESALDQFHRLKREVQKHVHRLQEEPCASGNGNY